MKLVVLVLLVLIAFAANSVLGRMAIGWGYMDAMGFGLLRLASGAVALVLLVALQAARSRSKRAGETRVAAWKDALLGGAALTLYMIGFCLAYQGLDAGLGALVLFGVVQISMFGWGALRGSRTTAGQVLGALVAFAGLAYVVWPSGPVQVPPGAAALMTLSGLGWAAYTLLGRGAGDPLRASAMNFVVATLMMLPFMLFAAASLHASPEGILLAVISGAVTSGMGYALWYRVLPELQPAVAATIQLSVPIIAILGGFVFLAEPVRLRLALGTCAVLGGIALVIWSAPRAR